MTQKIMVKDNVDQVRELRNITGAGIMDCKRALEAAKGDYEKAKALIAEQGITKAAKKEERTTGAGHLELYLHSGRVGVMLELRAETDFVTRSEQFKELAKNVAMHIAAMNPSYISNTEIPDSAKDKERQVLRAKALEEGKILVDFDARTGHNHGTKFRMRQDCLPMLYKKVTEII